MTSIHKLTYFSSRTLDQRFEQRLKMKFPLRIRKELLNLMVFPCSPKLEYEGNYENPSRDYEDKGEHVRMPNSIPIRPVFVNILYKRKAEKLLKSSTVRSKINLVRLSLISYKLPFEISRQETPQLILLYSNDLRCLQILLKRGVKLVDLGFLAADL
jgi:hypothetical protein